MFKQSFTKKVLVSSCFTLALGLSCSALAHDSYSHNQTSNVYATANHAVAPSDTELAKQIHDKISSGWFSTGYDQVKAKVNNGTVVLTGVVDKWDDKDKVEKEVRNIEGVRVLESHLSVREPASERNQQVFSQDTFATPADEQLNKKIRDNVSIGWLWNSYKDTALNTNNGVVTIVGVVDSPSDQQKLVTELQKIEGVKAVKSNLRIKNP